MSYFLVEVRPIIALIGAIFENARIHLLTKVNIHSKRGRLSLSVYIFTFGSKCVLAFLKIAPISAIIGRNSTGK